MITTLVLIAIAILALAFFFGMLRGRAAAVPDVSDLRDQVRPVDLAAFRNLVDPDEESYLREHLPRGEFRAIRRERLRAGIDYVQCVVESGKRRAAAKTPRWPPPVRNSLTALCDCGSMRCSRKGSSMPVFSYRACASRRREFPIPTNTWPGWSAAWAACRTSDRPTRSQILSSGKILWGVDSGQFD